MSTWWTNDEGLRLGHVLATITKGGYITPMTSIGIRDLRNNLSRIIERVRAGAVISVTDHGREVARLSPPPASGSAADAFDALVAAGVILAPSEPQSPFVYWPTIRGRRGRRGLAAALIDEDRGE